jgi:hypothetical protein
MLQKVQAFLDGKKTYIVAIITGVLGIVSAYHPIPEVVWTILGAIGLGTIRSAIGTGNTTTK